MSSTVSRKYGASTSRMTALSLSAVLHQLFGLLRKETALVPHDLAPRPQSRRAHRTTSAPRLAAAMLSALASKRTPILPGRLFAHFPCSASGAPCPPGPAASTYAARVREPCRLDDTSTTNETSLHIPPMSGGGSSTIHRPRRFVFVPCTCRRSLGLRPGVSCRPRPSEGNVVPPPAILAAKNMHIADVTPEFWSVDAAATRLSLTLIALRTRCRRAARREGREVVANLGGA